MAPNKLPAGQRNLPNSFAATSSANGDQDNNTFNQRRPSLSAGKRRRVTRTDINICLDILLLILFVALCTCSVIVDCVFPIGTHADGWSLWSQSYASWSRIRFGMLAALAGAVLVHLMLHWSWVCGVVAGRLGKKVGAGAAQDDPSRTLWGVGLLIVVINVVGMIVAVAVLSIHAPPAGP